MEPIIVWYLRMSIFYFLTGALSGFAMVLWPEEAGYYLRLHVHLNLLGFMSMMIYGVGYHILPKFSGRQIYSPSIMNIQFWLSNAGLLGMGTGWFFMAKTDLSVFETLLILSSFMSLVSVALFSINLLKTIKAAPALKH